MHYAGMLTRPGVSSQGQGQKSQGQGQGQRSRLRSNSIVMACNCSLVQNSINPQQISKQSWRPTMAVPMTLVYQCTVSVIIPRYTVLEEYWSFVHTLQQSPNWELLPLDYLISCPIRFCTTNSIGIEIEISE